MNTPHHASSFYSALIAVIVLTSLTLTTPLFAQEPVDYFAGYGSFEGGVFVSPLFPGAPFSGSNTAVPGWTMSASGSSVTWLENTEAQDGDRHIIVRSRGGSAPGSSSARFDFAISPIPFTVGELYELSFWAAGGAATSGVNQVIVTLSGGGNFGMGISQIVSLPAYTQAEFDALTELEWQEFVIPFTAGTELPTLNMGAVVPAALASSIYLDNFSIRPVPEPSGALLAGTALGLSLLSRRRRAAK